MKKLITALLALVLPLSCLSALAGDATIILQGTVDGLLADAGAVVHGSEYRVIVCDTEGDPVEGAVIQLCDDVTCAFQPTDAEGVAAFSVGEEKVYEVHVLMAPEGYAPDETVYRTEDTFSELSITLKKVE